MSGYDALRAAMVGEQLERRGINDPAVLRAMHEVPREVFVPEHLIEHSYDDGPLPIGQGQTISQPFIVALMIESACVAPGDRVLEVGAGSGYGAAVLSRIAGQVIAIERHADLAQSAGERIAMLGYDNCRIDTGDGSAGIADEAPFDAIIIAAGGATIPEPLRRQLAIGGRLIMPVGSTAMQVLCRLTRTAEDEWEERNLCDVRFVPLIGEHGRIDDDELQGS